MIVTLALVVLLLCILQTVQNYGIKTAASALLEESSTLSAFAGEYLVGQGDAAAFSPSLYADTRMDRILLLDLESRVVFDSREAGSYRGKMIADPLVLRAFSGESTVQETTEGDLLYLQAAVPVYREGALVGVLLEKTPMHSMQDFFSHLRYRIIVIGISASLILGLVGIFLSSVFTAPISRLTSQIQEMSVTDAHKIEPVRGSGEIKALISAFNLMVERIDDIDSRRQEFVSNASHELKTPLSSIKLICDSLLQNPDTDREMVNEFLADMNEQVDRLTRIVNKLLSLTKLDSSTDEAEIFAFSTVNLQTMMQNVVRALLPLAQQKNIRLETHFPDNIFLRVDADKIWEAVYNILDNSIKYTPEDGRVYAELYRDEQNVYITIADSGIGMAEDEFGKIFDRFYRVDKARARETGGTGLGLSIALGAVELHGGYIEVESREEEGSLFRIVLPVSSDL